MSEDDLPILAQEMKEKGHLGLKIEKEKSPTTDLKFLLNFDHLEELFVYGLKKNINTISHLKNLKSLALCGISTKDLMFIHELTCLEELWLQGIKLTDWSSLGKLHQVKKITFFNMRNDNFDFISLMSGLQLIVFDRCSQLKKIPNLSGLPSLRRVVIDTANNLSDLSDFSTSPNLEDLVITNCSSIESQSIKNMLDSKSEFHVYGNLNNNDIIPNSRKIDSFFGTDREQFTLQ